MIYLMVRDGDTGESWVTIPDTEPSASDAYYIGQTEARVFQKQLNEIAGHERFYVTLEFAWHKHELLDITEAEKENA